MVSKGAARQKSIAIEEKWMQEAIKMYQLEQGKGQGERKKGLRVICAEMKRSAGKKIR